MEVRLIHWNRDEASERAERLRALGYSVTHDPLDRAALRRMRTEPPDVVLIDLGRLPSQGRDIAVNIRKYKASRDIPLVFVDGAPEKVESVRALLPDAVFTEWNQIDTALKQAIAHPPQYPVVPESLMAGYSGKPLAKKLGIQVGTVLGLFGAPEGFETTLGELPEGVRVRREPTDPCDLTLWFVRAQEEMERRIERMRSFAEEGGLWIAWPKKSSGVVSDLSQNIVRQTGLESGLVDYKVCAIDATWSGLLFTKREGNSEKGAKVP